MLVLVLDAGPIPEHFDGSSCSDEGVRVADEHEHEHEQEHEVPSRGWHARSPYGLGACGTKRPAWPIRTCR